MKLHAPSIPVFWTAVVLVVLALVGHFVPDAGLLYHYQFWLAIAAAVVLAVGCVA